MMIQNEQFPPDMIQVINGNAAETAKLSEISLHFFEANKNPFMTLL